MRTLPLWLVTLSLGGLAGISTPSHAAQSYDNCTGFITTLPATINTQGVWCFNKNLETSITIGNAITINANNVTIDCNDFKLGGLQAGVGTYTFGIRANGRLNATVRHCNIRGFLNGVVLDGGGHLVEDNRFDGNTHIGIAVSGDGSLVQRNRVNTTAGSTSVPGDAWGIYATYGVDILDNSVDGVAPSANVGNGNVYGIYTVFNNSGSVIGNRVRGLVPLGAGIAEGIYNKFSGRLSLRRNDVVGPGTVAIYCDNYYATGSATDNVMNGFTTGLSGCDNDWGNVIK